MVTDKEKISTISSILMIVGCLLPWKELLTLKERGFDTATGGIVISLGIITLVITIFNILSSEKTSKLKYNKFLGFIAISLLAYEHFELRKILNEIKISSDVANIGIGLYVSFLGSLGILLSDINLTTLKTNSLNALISSNKHIIDNIKSNQPRNDMDIKSVSKHNETELSFNKQLVQINELITKQKKSMFGNEFGALAIQLINNIVQSKEDANLLLEKYQNYFDKDLIEELKSFSSSYPKIQKNLQLFIEIGIVEEKYPHIRIKN